MTLGHLFIVLSVMINIGVGLEYPWSAWTCTHGTCEIAENCGMTAGKSCAKLTYSSTAGYSHFQSPSLSAPALSTWLYTAYARCQTSSPSLFFAWSSSSYSTGKVVDASGNSWTRYEFLMRVSQSASSSPMALGVYSQSVCFFDNVSATKVEVSPFHYPPFGLLGKGETITGGVYRSTWGGSTIMGNYVRTINSFVSSFMDTVFRIYTGHILSMNHTLAVPFVSSPKITVIPGNCYTGYLLLQASGDNGVTWETFGNISTSASLIVHLPSVSYTQVRFKGYGPSGNGIHIEGYTFEAGVASSGEEVSGIETILALDSITPSANANLSVSLENGLDDFPTWTGSSPISFPLYVKSQQTSGSTVSPTLTITPRFPTSTITVSPSTISSISPSSAGSTTLSYQLSTGKSEIATIRLADSTNTYLTGRIIFNLPHFLLDSTYGELLSTSSSSSLWWCDSTRKISLYRSAPTMASTKIAISAARNEREPFQLVIRSKSSPITINSISISDLSNGKGSILSSANEITIRREMHLRTELASDGSIGVSGGYWPDPLVPLDLPYVCKSNTNCPFWILVHTPSDQKEGNYSGSISITTSTGALSAKLQLRVYNFSIPKHTNLRSRFGVRESSGWKYYNMNSSSPSWQKENLWNLYLKSFEEHRLNPGNAHKYHNMYTALVKNTTTGIANWKFDFTQFEANYKKYYIDDSGFGFNHIESEIPGMSGGTWQTRTIGYLAGYEWGTPEHTRLLTDYLKAFQAELIKTNLLDKDVVSWFDEPREDDYPYIQEESQKIMNAAPQLNKFLTEPPVSDLYGFINTWCPWVTQYNHETARIRQGLGEKVWIYAPHYIDYPAMQLRSLIWFIFVNDIDGFLIWAPDIWFHDPYSDLMFWDNGKADGNCNGRLLYPPVNWNTTKDSLYNSSPVESIRWEMLREGIEDWEYLKLLEEQSQRNLQSDIKAKVLRVLDVPNSIVFDYSYIYSYNPNELLKKREEIGLLLEELQVANDLSANSDDSTKGNQLNSANHFGHLKILTNILFTFVIIIH